MHSMRSVSVHPFLLLLFCYCFNMCMCIVIMIAVIVLLSVTKMTRINIIIDFPSSLDHSDVANKR